MPIAIIQPDIQFDGKISRTMDCLGNWSTSAYAVHLAGLFKLVIRKTGSSVNMVWCLPSTIRHWRTSSCFQHHPISQNLIYEYFYRTLIIPNITSSVPQTTYKNSTEGWFHEWYGPCSLNFPFLKSMNSCDFKFN